MHDDLVKEFIVSEPKEVDAMLKSLTKETLGYTSGNRTEAAKLMGISIRTLRNWIKKYKLSKDYPPKRPPSQKADE